MNETTYKLLCKFIHVTDTTDVFKTIDAILEDYSSKISLKKKEVDLEKLNRIEVMERLEEKQENIDDSVEYSMAAKCEKSAIVQLDILQDRYRILTDLYNYYSRVYGLLSGSFPKGRIVLIHFDCVLDQEKLNKIYVDLGATIDNTNPNEVLLVTNDLDIDKKVIFNRYIQF
jgi:hypothetical protein